jgi:hypothetical protein
MTDCGAAAVSVLKDASFQRRELISSACGDPLFQVGEEAGVPFLGQRRGVLPLPRGFGLGSTTTQERQATGVKVRQSLPFAP